MCDCLLSRIVVLSVALDYLLKKNPVSINEAASSFDVNRSRDPVRRNRSENARKKKFFRDTAMYLCIDTSRKRKNV